MQYQGKYLSGIREAEENIKTMLIEDIALKVPVPVQYTYIPDVTCDERCAKTGCWSIGVTSLLSAPIKSGSNIIGVINCGHPIRETFDENKINLHRSPCKFCRTDNITFWSPKQDVLMERGIAGRGAEKNLLIPKEKMQNSANLQSRIALTNLYNRRFFFARA